MRMAFCSPSISFSTFLKRSSTSPLYDAPAVSAALSTSYAWYPLRKEGTLPAVSCFTNPLMSDVLPTPASPVTRRFDFVLRPRISKITAISFSNPTIVSFSTSTPRVMQYLAMLLVPVLDEALSIYGCETAAAVALTFAPPFSILAHISAVVRGSVFNWSKVKPTPGVTRAARMQTGEHSFSSKRIRKLSASSMTASASSDKSRSLDGRVARGDRVICMSAQSCR